MELPSREVPSTDPEEGEMDSCSSQDGSLSDGELSNRELSNWELSLDEDDTTSSSSSVEGIDDETSLNASEYEPRSHPRWRVVFYPQSFLRDQGSLTVAPTPSNPIWTRGLRFGQLYNPSKDAFAAGSHYLFGHDQLDTLALDPQMARSWQHTSGAVSASPLAALQAYLHTKQ